MPSIFVVVVALWSVHVSLFWSIGGLNRGHFQFLVAYKFSIQNFIYTDVQTKKQSNKFKNILYSETHSPDRFSPGPSAMTHNFGFRNIIQILRCV